MNGLMVHAGARKVFADQLTEIATPAATSTWCPIPHKALLDGVQGSLVRSGFKILSQEHALGAEGDRYFGLLTVGFDGASAVDYATVVGIRNAHDMSFTAGIACGSSVFVCDNLAFSAEVTIARKHTRFITRDLPGLIESAVGRLGGLRRHQDERIRTYKQTELSDGRVHDLLIQALDARIVPVTRIPDVLQEWRSPRHPEFAAAGKTAWRLFNGFTQVLKDSSLFRRPQATQALHGLVDTACGMSVSRN